MNSVIAPGTVVRVIGWMRRIQLGAEAKLPSAALRPLWRWQTWAMIGCCMLGVLASWELCAQGDGVNTPRPDTHRYTGAPQAGGAHVNRRYYQRYRQPYQDVGQRGSDLQSSIEIESIDLSVRQRRQQLEMLRQSNHRLRTLSSDPARSEQLRMDFDREQQSFDRWQKKMQQRRADAERRRDTNP